MDNWGNARWTVLGAMLLGLLLLAQVSVWAGSASHAAPGAPGPALGALHAGPTTLPGGSPGARTGGQTILASNSTVEPPHSLAPSLPQLPGGSWSSVDQLLTLPGGQFDLLGADNASGAKIGELSMGTTPTVADLTGGFLSTAPATDAGAVQGGALSNGAYPTVFLWGQGSAGPVLMEQNVSNGTFRPAYGFTPLALQVLGGGGVVGAQVALVGGNYSTGPAQPIVVVYNDSFGFSLFTGVPLAFHALVGALTTPSGIVVSGSGPNGTLGMLSFAGGNWAFTNYTSLLPSSFGEPVTPLASAGNYVLVGSPGGVYTGIVNLTGGPFVNLSASLAASTGSPSAAATDPAVTNGISVASSLGLAVVDARTGTVTASPTSPFPPGVVPLALDWNGTTLMVGGWRNGQAAELASWGSTAGYRTLRGDLGSGLVDASALALASGHLFVAGTNGTAGSLVSIDLGNLTTRDLTGALPAGVRALTLSVASPKAIYFSDGTRVLALNTTTLVLTDITSGLDPDLVVDAMGWNSGRLLVGGILQQHNGATQEVSAGGGLFSYAPGGALWTNLSASLTSLSEVTTIATDGAGNAFLGGEQQPEASGIGDFYYYAPASATPFTNVSTQFVSNLFVPFAAAWNGTTFWVGGTGALVNWTDGGQGAFDLSGPLPLPTNMLSVTSISVLANTYLLGGQGYETSPTVPGPEVLQGVEGISQQDLTTGVGLLWQWPPSTLAADGLLWAGDGALNGTADVVELPAPFAGTLTANAQVLDAPANLTLSLTGLSGGVQPYGTPTFTTSVGTASGYTATFQLTAPGTYAVSVNVSDAVGVVLTINAKVTISSPLSISGTVTPTSGSTPLALTASWVVSGGSSPYTIVVAFGDGTTYSSAIPVSSATHTFTAAGTYSVLLQVTDSTGAQAGVPAVTVTVAAGSGGGGPPPGGGGNNSTGTHTGPTSQSPWYAGTQGALVFGIVVIAVLVLVGLALFIRSQDRMRRRRMGSGKRSHPTGGSSVAEGSEGPSAPGGAGETPMAEAPMGPPPPQ